MERFEFCTWRGDIGLVPGRLRLAGVRKNTIVALASDNEPWRDDRLWETLPESTDPLSG